MRFGKRNKGPLALGRRTKSDSDDPAFEPVASEERSALLSSPGEPEEPRLTSDKPDAEFATSDPTQRLLTALGRFHRQVGKARGGTPQELWSDECMNQLITAAEIALSQKWSDVVAALTDTARVLQTYEDAGCAQSSVPFLADSYEILCLMVGDLIVGRVRPGVIQKWKERYAAALDELNAAGLRLVQDDEESAHSRAEEAGPVTPAGGVLLEAPAEPAPEMPFEEPAYEPPSEGSPEEALPTLDDLPPLKHEPEAVVALNAEATRESTGAEDQIPGLSVTPTEVPVAAISVPTPAAPDASQKLAAMLDAFCEDLSRIENERAGDVTPAFAPIGEHLNALSQQAEQDQRFGALQACRRMAELCDAVASAGTRPDDKFFELGYAFCGIYAEAGDRDDDPNAQNWMSECANYMEMLGSSEVPAEPSSETAPKDRESPEALLETARQAAAGGRASDAKLLALQAAMHFARMESQEAEERVRRCELRLRQGEEAIESARNAVLDIEQEVRHAEGKVAEGKAALEQRRAGVESVKCRLAGIEARLSELEAQIRELTCQRDEQARLAADAQIELEAQTRQQQEADRSLEQLLESEQVARLRLEDARQDVKRLQSKRSEVEAALERSRESLTRQRASLADIEQTIVQLRSGEEVGAGSEDDLLF